MAQLRRFEFLPASNSTWRRLGALALLLIGLALSGNAAAQTARLDDSLNWRLEPVVWGKVAGISDGANILAPITAHYNMAYGATVLGLNAREGGSVYYAVIANYRDGQLDVLDTLGPLEAPAEWHSGPYHLAAGLPDGRLVVFLTVPGKYPSQVTISWEYAPHTPFDCVVRPPDPPSELWEAWSITAAYQLDLPEPELAVKTYDGRGLVMDEASAIEIWQRLLSVVYYDRPISKGSIPTLGCVTNRGVFAAWHEYGWGWHIEKLAGEQLGNARLGVAPRAADPAFVALFLDDTDPFATLKLQRIGLNYSEGGIAIRWGQSGSLPEIVDIRSQCFINSLLSPEPLLAYATDADVFLAWQDNRADSREQGLPLRTTRLHFGERLTGTNSNTPAYPILGLAGAAHWSSGYPEIFWVQLGSRFSGGGQVFRLAYEPSPNWQR